MVEDFFVQALYNQLPTVAEILQHSQGFLINSMCVIVLSYCTIVVVGELSLSLALAEKVIDIYHIDVSILADLILFVHIHQGVEVALISLETNSQSKIMISFILSPFQSIAHISSF